jgi:protein involved in polysaccharide export with SLBB domain
MKKHLRINRGRVCLFLMLLAFPSVLAGQERTYQSGSYNGRTHAIDEANSRAAQEAEQMVSLSADKIIAILRNEPGLLLEVKKMLVKKAYEQGRILDAADLTDEALFRLLREDDNIRVLATREIEDRYYVRAKPTREELERERISAEERGRARTLAPNQPSGQAAPSQVHATRSQEEIYWDKHERDWENYGVPNSAPQPEQPYQPYQPSTPTPRNPAPQDPARSVERASLQQSQEAFDGISMGMDSLGSGTAEMWQIRPDELPDLLNVDSRAGSAARGRVGAGDLQGSLERPLPDLDALSRSRIQAAGSSIGMGAPNRIPERSQQARLVNPRPPIPSPSDLNEDRPLIRHRPNPYANVPLLYDLYAQVSRRPPVLERFGMDVFRNGTGNLDDLPMDLPAGPDYVVGPGDGLSIELWGGVAQRLQRVVDREGRVALPEVGAVQVSGRSLGDVQHLVQSVLRSQFRDVEADVSLARIRSVRVYVVGDAASPGAYDISSLSTPLNALYAAGGPTSRGSLRHLRHYRGKQLVEEIDAYDLLLHGIHGELARIQSGDTILVPPIGPEVTVEGMVRRPSIYELDGEKTLAEVLELAGGVLPSGTLRHVDLERLMAHEKRTMLRLDLPESNDEQAVNKALDEFQVQDGDKVKISPILPYADKTVYLDGHVFRPGKYPYRDGMKVTDIVHSYTDLLPEPSRRHAEIIRLEPPDYTPVVLAFNLSDAMESNGQNLVLKPFDTIRVFSRYDFEDPPVITVSGEVRDPGDHITNGVTHLRDAVYLAGGVSSDAELDDAQIFRKTNDRKLKVISVNLAKALAGNPKDDILLEPKDQVFIHRSQTKVDPSTVIIQGQVAKPGKYPLGDTMNAADLVRLAGGLKRGAYTQTADLTRYLVEEDKKVVGEHMTVPIAAALSGQPDADVRLRDGDVLTVGELAGWNDVGATIAVKGEVVHPGTYGIREGERLSSILQRAGGLRADAYPYGTVFERVQVRELEEKNRSDLMQRVQEEGSALKIAPDGDQDQKLAKEAALAQWQTAVERLRNTPPPGRLVIHVSTDMKRWANTSADIQVRAGDVIYIPKRPNIVMVDGSVYNPTAVTYKPGKSAGWYLRQAGGPTNMANKRAIFVIRADGSVVGGSGGLFSGGAESAALQPGDMVVVPEKGFSANTRWKNTLQAAQLAYAVGIAIQVSRSF